MFYLCRDGNERVKDVHMQASYLVFWYLWPVFVQGLLTTVGNWDTESRGEKQLRIGFVGR